MLYRERELGEVAVPEHIYEGAGPLVRRVLGEEVKRQGPATPVVAGAPLPCYVLSCRARLACSVPAPPRSVWGGLLWWSYNALTPHRRLARRMVSLTLDRCPEGAGRGEVFVASSYFPSRLDGFCSG